MKGTQMTNKELVALAEELHSHLDLRGLTEMQKAFILKQDGRKLTAIAAEAGYSCPRVAVHRLMANEQIRKNIDVISAILQRTIIASKLDVLLFWSEVMEGKRTADGFSPSDRMNASEKLGRVHNLLGPNSIVNINQKEDNIINIIIQDPKPINAEEQAEFDRLQAAINENEIIELESMGRTPPKRIEAEIIDDSNTMI